MVEPATFLRRLTEDVHQAGGRFVIRNFTDKEELLTLPEPVLFSYQTGHRIWVTWLSFHTAMDCTRIMVMPCICWLNREPSSEKVKRSHCLAVLESAPRRICILKSGRMVNRSILKIFFLRYANDKIIIHKRHLRIGNERGVL